MKKNKKQGKIAFISVLIGFCAVVPAFSQSPTLQELQNQAGDFSDSLAKSLPFNAALGLNWSDAYIGQLLGVPPHFGFGVSMGATTIKMSSLEKLMGQFGLDVPLNMGGFPLPGYTVEGRVGGFILPFDVGLKFGILPLSLGDDVKMTYTLVGGDVRYAVLKGNAALPTISVGAGFNFLSGGLEKDLGSKRDFTYTTGTSSHTLELGAPTVGFKWETASLDFKAQVSKSFLIVTPYLGLGASHAWSKAGYEASAKIKVDGNELTTTEIADINKLGITDITGTGFSSIQEVTGWSIRGFGGLSVNLAVIRLDLTGLYNFMDSNYGLSLGVRFQL